LNPLSDSLLWAVFFYKIAEEAHIFGLPFSMVQVMHAFRQKNGGATFWSICHKLIWSPCQHCTYIIHKRHSAVMLNEVPMREQQTIPKISKFFETRDRFYDHDFLRFSTIFGEKMAFLSKTNVMIKFLHNLALF
jgi:hypothetical protein